MIPLADNVPRERYPFVTYALIALNVFVFFIERAQGSAIESFIRAWGLVPARLPSWQCQPWVLVTLITSMFLHAGWLHLIGNMIYLWVFGQTVEGAMGAGRFAVFYLMCGVAANLAEAAMMAGSQAPGLGASGAIAGVLGAYLLLFPRAQVFLLVPLLIWFPVIALPAAFVLSWWFGLQLLSGVGELTAAHAAAGGVAYWAHVGGFVFGMATVFLFRQKRRHAIQYYDAWQHSRLAG